jgi:hypothetical protein
LRLEEEQIESRSPAAYIERYRHKGYSVLHLISDEEFSRGMRQMDEDANEVPFHLLAPTRYFGLGCRSELFHGNCVEKGC